MRFIRCILVLLIAGSLFAQQELVISGKAVGHDGKPMIKAHVHLERFSDQKPLVSTEVSNDGSFKFTTSETGLFRIHFTGVNHSPKGVGILVEKPETIRIDVQLAAYPYHDSFSNVRIIGDFNKFSFASAEPMVKQDDGTFISEFKTDSATFKYQIVGILADTRSINGTQSEDYEYDGGGDYRSVVTPKDGKVRIIFDPKKLVRGATAPLESKVEFRKGSGRRALLAKEIDEIEKRRNAFLKALMTHRESGKEMKDFMYDWSADLSSLSTKIRNEKDPAIRQILLASYLDIGGMSIRPLDSTIAAFALKEIPPSSWLWALSPTMARTVGVSMGKSFKTDEFIEKLLEQNPDRMLKATLLFYDLTTAKFLNDTLKFQKSYHRLTNEFGDTQFGKMAKERFPLESKIAVGKPVPAFSLVSLGDPQKTFTNEMFKGKITLIDFWAVWCAPCIAEMDHLHKAYEKFKEKGFQILSLSFDVKPEDVVEFRKKKWNMPWLNAFIKDGFNNPIARDFEVIGIPKPILVDSNGIILALDMQLRGENLEKTLERVLGK